MSFDAQLNIHGVSEKTAFSVFLTQPEGIQKKRLYVLILCKKVHQIYNRCFSLSLKMRPL